MHPKSVYKGPWIVLIKDLKRGIVSPFLLKYTGKSTLSSNSQKINRNCTEAKAEELKSPDCNIQVSG
jgi:hypothetical protein